MSAAPMPGEPDTQPQILIVEDEAVIVLDIRTRLLQMGYRVLQSASTKDEAVGIAGRYLPDLVLMDIRLRDNHSGIEAADEIHKQFRIPVIYLTAHADETTIQQAKLTRPYGYILKPFNDGELRAAIEIALFRSEIDRKYPQPEEVIKKGGISIKDRVSTIISPFRGYAPGPTSVFMRLPLNTSKAVDQALLTRWRIALIPKDSHKDPILIELFDDVRIGRDDPGTLRIDLDLQGYDAAELGVSRHHALIRPERTGLYLYDLGSTNGTFCGEKRAWLGRPLKLENGNIIAFGELLFKLMIIEQPDSGIPEIR